MSYHLRSEHVRVNLLMMNWRTCLVMFCDQISRCLIIDENLETCHNTSSLIKRELEKERQNIS